MGYGGSKRAKGRPVFGGSPLWGGSVTQGQVISGPCAEPMTTVSSGSTEDQGDAKAWWWGVGGACLLSQVCKRQGEAGWEDRGRWAGSQKTDIVLVRGAEGEQQ